MLWENQEIANCAIFVDCLMHAFTYRLFACTSFDVMRQIKESAMLSK